MMPAALMMMPGARGQDRRLRALAVDRNRLGNGDGSEATRIDHVDLAVRGRLRDGASERLAGPCGCTELASSPTPDTHVRVACANAGALTISAITMKHRDHSS
jgi:hypothetical protein